MTITVHYTSIDWCSERRTYKTLKGAQKWAQDMIGDTPDLGSHYAVSFDGIGKIEVTGCTLRDLFPKLAAEAAADLRPVHEDYSDREVADRELYGDYADLDPWQEHCDHEANADADYRHEAYAGMQDEGDYGDYFPDDANTATEADLLADAAEAAALFAKDAQDAQDELERRHPTLQRPVLYVDPLTYDDIPF